MDGYRRKLFATAFAVAAMLAACNRKPPTSPSPPPGASGPVTILRLELTGPGTVPIGQTLKFTATAHQSDGTTRDVTAEAAWSAANMGFLTLAAPGQFTGRSNGQTSVRAAVGGRSATMSDIIIVPEGTFRISGSVRDAGSLVEADVRIDDEALGRTDLPTTLGRFVVFGVRGNTRVTVTKGGYETAVTSHAVASHQAIDIDLTLSRPRADISGRYTLTIAAAPECRTLASEFASRSFPAVVSQSGSAITVTLDGPEFVVSGSRTLNRFTGLLEVDQAIFRLTAAFDFYYYYFTFPDVFELVAVNSYYSFDGVVTATVGPGTLSGPLSGSIGNYLGPSFRTAAACRSTNHRFVLTKATT